MTESEYRAARAFLCRGRGIRREIEDMRNRIDRAYAALTNATGSSCGERVSSSGGNAEEWRRVEYGELIHTLETLERRLINVSNDMIETINLVADMRLRRILSAYYVDCMTHEAIADTLDMSYRHEYRLYKKALRAFAEVHASRNP